MSSCVNCPPKPEEFPRDGFVSVGFGLAGLYRDGVMVIDGEDHEYEEDMLTGEKCEEIAAADPNHKWEIVLNGPLSGATYERNAEGRWLCTSRNEGFA